MPLRKTCPKNDVKEQLGRILRNSQFSNAPRLSRFLTYVVLRTLDGQPDLLKGYTIGVEVFDRDPGFDPQSDTIVRVQARALRQKLEHYYSTDGANDPVRITIAKGGYKPEFTFASHEAFSDWPLRAKRPSIAVLPFDYTGDDDCYAFMSRGLTEGCIAKLSCFKDLAVFSRSTTEKAKIAHWSIAEIYQKFAPDFVLEGSFRIGDKLAQAQMKLVNAATDEVIMTDVISVPLDTGDIYGLQDEIALLVASRIGAEAGPIGQYATREKSASPSVKWETYRWISQYYQTGVTLAAAGRDRIRAGLSQAMLADPDSSEAYATMAMLDIDQYRDMTGRQGDHATIDKALDYAKLAVKYEPQSAMAHQALAIACFHQRRFHDFRAHVKRALALNPGHADMLVMFGICHVARANWDEAAPLLDRAIGLNPLHPNWYGVAKAILLAHTTSIDEALVEMHNAPMSGFYAFHLHLIWMHVGAGDMAAAMVEKDRLLDVLPNAEACILRHFETWCLADALVERITSALRKVGLHLTA